MTTTLREITPQQQRVLLFISSYKRQHGFGPCMREIAAEFGFKSTNGVETHLRALEKKGYIRRDRKRARAITVVRLGPGMMPWDPELLNELLGDREKLFALVVSCDVHADKHIVRGDYLIVRPDQDADEGRLVVVESGSPGVYRLYRLKAPRQGSNVVVAMVRKAG